MWISAARAAPPPRSAQRSISSFALALIKDSDLRLQNELYAIGPRVPDELGGKIMASFCSRCCMSVAAITLAAMGQPSSAQPDASVNWPPPGVSYHGDPGSPDFSGLWLGSAMAVPGGEPETNSRASSDGRPPVHWAPWPLPYRPKYQAILDERTKATAKGIALGDVGARCRPFGLSLMLSSKVYPDEIVQTPGSVVFFMYGSFPVVVWTDGRPHPANLQRSANGHSIGHWVNDTLHVETVGLSAETPLDGMRNPHSEKLMLEWAVRRVATDVLHVHLTLHDEEAFTEPVTMTNIWHRKSDPKWQILDDGSCFENASGISDKPPEEGFIRF